MKSELSEIAMVLAPIAESVIDTTIEAVVSSPLAIEIEVFTGGVVSEEIPPPPPAATQLFPLKEYPSLQVIVQLTATVPLLTELFEHI